MITCPVSVGELFDKISILEIKIEYLHGEEVISSIKNEMNLLQEQKSKHILKMHEIALDELYDELFKVNKKIWFNEERKRELGKNKCFGKEFIQVNVLSYELNDKRASLKKQINEISNSEIREFKSHLSVN